MRLLPLVLGGLIVAAVASTRRAAPKVGSVVAVPITKLAGAVLPPNLIPPDALAAVQVDGVEGDQVRGSVVGSVNAATKAVTRLPLPVGIGPFGFTQDDIIV